MQTIPVHLDLFALVILLGVAQGIFLGLFFLSGARRKEAANRCLGWFMLALTAITTEIFLDYSNYLFRVLALSDFAEPFNFLLGPLFLLFVYSRIHGRLPDRWAWHLVPFVVWTINAVTWLYQPISFKYNSYIGAWHPELPFVYSEQYIPEDFTGGLREYINELTMLSAFIYGAWSLLIIRRAYRRHGWSFWSAGVSGPLATLRMLVIWNVLFPVLILIVKINYREDLGDHFLASCITLFIYITSFLVMRGSPFFAEAGQLDVPVEPAYAAEPRKKYEKSSLSEEVEEAVLQRLTRLMADEKPYLRSDLSLPKLADQLDTTPHHLSQLLNDRLGQTFFDWLATHRIAEAQRLLRNPTTINLKIDEIAERVGYNSPSAFHTSFKRIVGQTPAQFRAQLSSSRSA